jgi:hypothetical protein
VDDHELIQDVVSTALSERKAVTMDLELSSQDDSVVMWSLAISPLEVRPPPHLRTALHSRPLKKPGSNSGSSLIQRMATRDQFLAAAQRGVKHRMPPFRFSFSGSNYPNYTKGCLFLFFCACYFAGTYIYNVSIAVVMASV